MIRSDLENVSRRSLLNLFASRANLRVRSWLLQRSEGKKVQFFTSSSSPQQEQTSKPLHRIFFQNQTWLAVTVDTPRASPGSAASCGSWTRPTHRDWIIRNPETARSDKSTRSVFPLALASSASTSGQCEQAGDYDSKLTGVTRELAPAYRPGWRGSISRLEPGVRGFPSGRRRFESGLSELRGGDCARARSRRPGRWSRCPFPRFDPAYPGMGPLALTASRAAAASTTRRSRKTGVRVTVGQRTRGALCRSLSRRVSRCTPVRASAACWAQEAADRDSHVVVESDRRQPTCSSLSQGSRDDASPVVVRPFLLYLLFFLLLLLHSSRIVVLLPFLALPYSQRIPRIFPPRSSLPTRSPRDVDCSVLYGEKFSGWFAAFLRGDARRRGNFPLLFLGRASRRWECFTSCTWRLRLALSTRLPLIIYLHTGLYMRSNI